MLVGFNDVITVLKSLPQNDQDVITDIAKEMGLGMAKYVDTVIETPKQYHEYCYYVAGLVGVGLTQLFQQSDLTEEEAIAMGLFLQKINIIRDIKEDQEQERFFWPNRDRVIDNLNFMCLDAVENIPQVLSYLEKTEKPVFQFCAIPQVLHITNILGNGYYDIATAV